MLQKVGINEFYDAIERKMQKCKTNSEYEEPYPVAFRNEYIVIVSHKTIKLHSLHILVCDGGDRRVVETFQVTCHNAYDADTEKSNQEVFEDIDTRVQQIYGISLKAKLPS